MIHVKRLGEPGVLTEKKADWQAKYDAKRAADPKAIRPESKQYGHPRIKETLHAMSHGKCFYCEALGTLEVDHYLEVAERGDLSFAWENLYLACKDCQRKIPNTSVPASECVDPCDAAVDPAAHLKFDAEYISWRTPRGEQTIKKYRLKQRDGERRRELQRFDAELLEICENKGWSQMSRAERERLLRYAKPDAPFSAMFRAYLDRFGLTADE